MDISELHELLNTPDEGKLKYETMTSGKIKDLAENADCNIARDKKTQLVLINGVVDPQKKQELIVFECPQAEWAGSNGITTLVRCKLLRKGLCPKHIPHDDLELGVSFIIREPEYKEK